jgi:hypothetical protein
MRPLAIDLYAGLGGWATGLLAEDYDVVGFDIERHEYGAHRYPAQLVVQDVLTLHGGQFRDAALIVASPPCQEYSYMAMPWKRAKAKALAIRADETGQMLADLNRLFDACFRIQAQASMAAGRHVPMAVENVRGAQPWVGRSRWAYGSYHLWGDVPALMPFTTARAALKRQPYERRHGTGSWFAIDMASSRAGITNPADIGHKVPGSRFDGSGRWFQSAAVAESGLKGVPHRTAGHWPNPAEHEGVKQGGTWWHDEGSISRTTGSASPGRKAASAMIAKIPEALARHIAAVYRPAGG